MLNPIFSCARFTTKLLGSEAFAEFILVLSQTKKTHICSANVAQLNGRLCHVVSIIL